MSECTHDCSNCSANCDSRQPSREDFIEKLNDMSRVGKVIGIVSGKGGVGKSLVTSLLAVTFNRRGLNTAILDADVTGPSIPKAFGVKEKAKGMEEYIIPAVTKTGIQMMSVNLLLDNETDPVVWRGPVIAGAVKQFWTDVIWKDVDYMFVDDVPLIVFQSIPLDGIVIVTSPQELVSMIVTKAVNMAKLMEIPILGIVENMSYAVCPDCGRHINVFGESKTDAIAAESGLKVLARLPIDPVLAANCDNGLIELYEGDWMEAAADAIEKAVQ